MFSVNSTNREGSRIKTQWDAPDDPPRGWYGAAGEPRRGYDAPREFGSPPKEPTVTFGIGSATSQQFGSPMKEPTVTFGIGSATSQQFGSPRKEPTVTFGIGSVTSLFGGSPKEPVKFGIGSVTSQFGGSQKEPVKFGIGGRWSSYEDGIKPASVWAISATNNGKLDKASTPPPAPEASVPGPENPPRPDPPSTPPSGKSATKKAEEDADQVAADAQLLREDEEEEAAELRRRRPQLPPSGAEWFPGNTAADLELEARVAEARRQRTRGVVSLWGAGHPLWRGGGGGGSMSADKAARVRAWDDAYAPPAAAGGGGEGVIITENALDQLGAPATRPGMRRESEKSAPQLEGTVVNIPEGEPPAPQRGLVARLLPNPGGRNLAALVCARLLLFLVCTPFEMLRFLAVDFILLVLEIVLSFCGSVLMVLVTSLFAAAFVVPAYVWVGRPFRPLFEPTPYPSRPSTDAGWATTTTARG